MEPTRKEHIVVGAGQIGSQLAVRLHRAGHAVRVLRQRDKAIEGHPEIPVSAGDVRDTAWFRAQLTHAEVVYGCANAPDYHRWNEQLPSLYRSVWQGAAAAGARLVMLDNLYGYGRVDAVPFGESAPVVPCSEKGRLRAQLQGELMAAAERGEVHAQIAMASDFFGPGTGEASVYGAAFVDGMRRGRRAMVLGDPTLRRAYSYAPDVAHGLFLLGTEPPKGSGRWHLPVSFTGTTEGFVRAFAEATGTQPRLFHMRAWMLTMAGWFSPTIGAVREMVYQWEHDFVPSDAKFTAAYGSQATPFEEAVRTTLAS